MPDISQEISQIRNAVFGEEVRGSIIDGLEKVNNDNESYNDVKIRIIETGKLLNDSDKIISSVQNAVSSAGRVEQKLNSAITSANSAKSKLDSSISNASTAQSNLQQVVNGAGTLVSNADAAFSKLSGGITDATDINSTLEETVKQAGTADTNLKKTISDANAVKSGRQGVVGDTKTMVNTLYPVGMVVWLQAGKDPNSLFPGTTWRSTLDTGYVIDALSPASNNNTGGSTDVATTEQVSTIPWLRTA